MPLEGHWQRQHTPLRSTSARERRVLAAVAALLAAGVAALVVHGLLSGSGSPSRSAGCVDVTAASIMGAVKLHACGGDAVRLCRSNVHETTPLARALRSQCRQLGVP